ncbi:MAG: hypothetical protein AUG49_13395 [Catenulispora sp. 13_1_20CM_3_70_7]|jgi:hypothetical protein|nr:MAG: hypothetical protein AUG49_13395 [Catenulispora sp. 13_1_20CM_3_70_7]
MPCHRCGARQTDPVKGASPWRRGVRAEEQVLICPECQRGQDWTADLAHCSRCGSARLVRVLGSTQCKDCGAEDCVADSDSVTVTQQALIEAAPPPADSLTPAAALARDVDAALERHFRHRND